MLGEIRVWRELARAGLSHTQLACCCPMGAMAPLSAYLPTCLSAYLSVCLSVCLPAGLPACLSFCLSACLSVS